MQHVVPGRSGTLRNRRGRQNAFKHVSTAQMRQIVTFARNEVVRDADMMTAPQELLRQMRSDKSCAAGHQIRSHDRPSRLLIVELSNADASASGGTLLPIKAGSAFAQL